MSKENNNISHPQEAAMPLYDIQTGERFVLAQPEPQPMLDSIHVYPAPSERESLHVRKREQGTELPSFREAAHSVF